MRALTSLSTFVMLAVPLTQSLGCARSPDADDDLVFESGAGGKGDEARPYGTFGRDPAGDAELATLQLNESRAYKTWQERANCTSGSCTDAFSGKYRFASSHEKQYIVLYDALSSDVSASFEYKVDGRSLDLRDTDTDSWFTLTRVEDVEMTAADLGGTFEITEGGDVNVRLPASPPSTGYTWMVQDTDDAFGEPAISFQDAAAAAIGSPGTTTLTWHTLGPVSVLGLHDVALVYVAPNGDWEKDFTFSVLVHSPESDF